MFVFSQQERIHKQINTVLDLFVNSFDPFASSDSRKNTIRPHFHLTGSSGSGKTFLVNRLCEAKGIPIIEINAAGITAEGLSGNSLSKALRQLREHWTKPNVIFVDEFDKLFQRNGETTEGFRSAVQDEFLTMLESKYASVFTDYGKYEPVLVENSLFIFSGAYSNQRIDGKVALSDAGMRPEFVGRVPLVFYTESVPLEELEKHLSKTDLFKRYVELLNYSKNQQQKASKEVINLMRTQSKQADIGIRLMTSCTHQYFINQEVGVNHNA